MEFCCGTCGKVFYTGWKARDQHCDATGHRRPKFECDVCSDYFGDEEDRREHMDECDHWDADAPECSQCYQRFPNASEVKQHEFDDHLYCAECDRDFQNRNNMQQHLKSRIHRPDNGPQCPFCNVTSGTATGLIHHLERGACPNAPLDRDKLYQAVRQRDPNGILAKKLIGWTGSTSYEATERAWNSRCNAFECYLCHRLFQSLVGLNQHLSSPIHQQALYHCPSRSCGKDFSTLAALVNHLESESCGYMRFQAILNTFADYGGAQLPSMRTDSSDGTRYRRQHFTTTKYLGYFLKDYKWVWTNQNIVATCDKQAAGIGVVKAAFNVISEASQLIATDVYQT
ncbi:hypothetical protein G7046_g4627 [Stylonectria norvegica]|nr:hypothetical protein G7046_g4627 [Stylonectria norvegica]